MHVQPHEAVWHTPMSQIALLIRQQQLHSDPQHAWTFSDQAFIAKLKAAGY